VLDSICIALEGPLRVNNVGSNWGEPVAYVRIAPKADESAIGQHRATHPIKFLCGEKWRSRPELHSLFPATVPKPCLVPLWCSPARQCVHRVHTPSRAFTRRRCSVIFRANRLAAPRAAAPRIAFFARKDPKSVRPPASHHARQCPLLLQEPPSFVFASICSFVPLATERSAANEAHKSSYATPRRCPPFAERDLWNVGQVIIPP
jgi:hypothetical protein